jgi:catechol 2,3-dioxygenase-like lactoylglutathione lyase family enzyme
VEAKCAWFWVPRPKSKDPVAPGNSDLCFVWPGTIDKAVAHLARHGVSVEEGPIERDAGSRGTATHIYFRDTDGSLLEFVSYTTSDS